MQVETQGDCDGRGRGRMMRLYHFTATEYVAAIMREGLTKGEVPVSPTDLLNAVWLTTDSSARGHGLTDGRPLTEHEREILGIPWWTPAKFPNKRAIRIAVDVPGDDPALVQWSIWSKARVSRRWYRILDETGGRKSHTWWLYWGVIPPVWFHDVEPLQASSVHPAIAA